MICILNPVPVSALGIAMGPTNIDIVDAVRGSEYKRTITVFNPSKEETGYKLTCEGDIESWISFRSPDTEKVVDTLTIQGGDKAVVLVTINVPGEVANGSYGATILAETIPEGDTSDSEVSAVLQAKTLVTIAVAGDEIISGSVIDIRTRDTEAGLPFRVEVIFKNTGNVIVSPGIECLIAAKDKPHDAVIKLSSDNHTVGIEKQDSIFLEAATKNLTNGEYLVSVKVYLKGELLKEATLPFVLLPPGTLTKQGELNAITYDGQPVLNSLIKIQGLFTNTGQVDVFAKLIAEIYINDVLSDTVESDEILVPSSFDSSITAYYKLEKNGTYVIKGYIAYDGKLTSSKEVSLSTENSQMTASEGNDVVDSTSVTDETEKSKSISWIPVIIAVIVLLLSGTGFFYIKQIKKHRASELLKEHPDSE